MDGDPVRAPARRGCDLNPRACASQNAPAVCGGSMAKEGVRTARKDGSHAAPGRPEPGMSHRVYAPEHQMQPAAPDLVVDRPRTEPERQELTPRNDSVLPGGQIGDLNST